MGLTISEKILSQHCGREVKAGEIVIVDVDLCYVQDGTGPLTVRQVKNLEVKKIHNPEKTILFLDHASPSPRLELSNDHKLLREFADMTGAVLSEVGGGISHHVSLESYANPGDVIVGADSHTCTNGALCAFSTGMGSTDVAVAFAFGKTWMRVPETFRIIVNGKFQKGAYSKDLIVHLIGKISSRGATYKALEFTGETIESMEVDARATIANMSVEAGAKVGLFASDKKTKVFLEKMGRGNKFREISSDPNAVFEKIIEINVSSLKPTIACPHMVDNVKTIEEIEDIKVDEVFIGTSCNGRIEDLREAAKILKGKEVKHGTRLIVTPASRRTYLEALNEEILKIFVEAGGVVTGPGCGACVGVHEGVLADGEVCFATQPRNFKGRMGNPKAFIYIGSPAVAAATAIKGKIADPREFL